MITEMTEEKRREVDKIFENYQIHNDDEKLNSDLEPYKIPSGAYSLYIRQCFDQLIYNTVGYKSKR